MEYLNVKRAEAGMGGGITHVNQCDAATRYRLREWVEAKRAKNFAVADQVRDDLRVKRIDPDKICAQDMFHEWSPLIMNAEKPVTQMFIPQNVAYPAPGMSGFSSFPSQQMNLMPAPTQMAQNSFKRPLPPSRRYEDLDDFTKREIDQWVDAKRNKDFAIADNVRMKLRAKQVEPDTIMEETQWLKKHKPNSWAGSAAAAPDAGPTPKVIRLPLEPSSQLCLQGYIHPLPAIEYHKDQTALSESTWIIQEFFEDGFNNHLKFHHDPEASAYPEVFNAWKAAGQEEACLTVVTCPTFQMAAVGMGGKKNGERAAKLAMAVALAGCHPRAEHVLNTYPSLREVLKAEETLQSGLRPPSGLPGTATNPDPAPMPGRFTL